LAGLLFGDVSPSGKLPMTFPVSLAQSPTSTTAQYPGLEPGDGQACDPGSPFGGATTVCQVDYSEDLAVGYKWYDQFQVDPLFEFGFGLTYTSFEYSGLSLDQNSDPAQGQTQLTVSFTVANTGSVTAAEVPQVYLTLPSSSATPGRRLVGFDRIELAPGQSQTVTATIDSTASDHPLSVWDVVADDWIVVEGAYEVAVGASSRDLRLSGQLLVDLSPAAPAAVAELVALVERVDALREADHTAESWAALVAARAQAVALLAAPDPTALAVEAAQAALQAAVNSLVRSGGGGLPGTGASLAPGLWGVTAGLFLVSGACLVWYDRRRRTTRSAV
jgi:hypothetical protein